MDLDYEQIVIDRAQALYDSDDAPALGCGDGQPEHECRCCFCREYVFAEGFRAARERLARHSAACGNPVAGIL